MQYMLLIYSGPSTDAYAELSPEQQEAVSGEYFAISNEPNVTGGAQLQPPETATTVRTGNGSALTTDGPFVETKEALGGYYLVEAADLDEAIALAKQVPVLNGGLEVRPIMVFS
jgi:hypothetical protein